MPNVSATDLRIDLRRNTLEIEIPTCEGISGFAGITRGTLDIGAQGRLLGIELGSLYVSVMDAEPGRDDLVRSAEIPVTLTTRDDGEGTSVTFRRMGADYEISWPSGNQCWTRQHIMGADGEPLRTCAVVVS